MWVLAAFVLGLLFIILSFARNVYTDWLWFSNLGFNGVFVKIIVTRIILFLVGALVLGAFLGTSVYLANRNSDGPIQLPIPQQAYNFVSRLINWGSGIAIVIISVIFGAILASRWELFLRFTNAMPFNQTDPLFNRDVSFYVFTLPVYDFIQGWLIGGAILILLASLGIYFLRFSLRGVPFEITQPMKLHLSIVAAIIMLIIAGGHWLDRWSLVLSDEGAIFGAAFADVNARMPGLLVMTIIAAASGVLMIVNIYASGIRLLVGAFALWVVTSIALVNVWPALVQQFTVTPNEFVREAPYISRNLDFTRRGFALDRISEQFYPAERSITSDMIENNIQTIGNVRLWDYRPLSDVYRQIQLIRPYYDFKDADVDRYVINGETRQVLLSAREVAPEKLDEQAQTWTNRKLIYTHGIGIAMSPVTEFTPEGRPIFYAQDIPKEGVIPISNPLSDSEPDLLVTNPRIYYGENTLEYVVVNTNTDEVDFNTREGTVYRTNYFGEGGVRLDSFIKRLAYAWQFSDMNILISGEITGESRLQYRRHIQERVLTVAPFLVLDKDPYIVATESQFFWMQDGYTTSNHFPYSDPTEDFNYMRNSAKVTIDAFNGSMNFYIWDASDPIVMTYANIFPDLFQVQNDMPEGLRAHVRYPQDFFLIQAEKYIRYHMKDPQNFYNNEDLWAIPNEKFGQEESLQPVEPYYVIMKLPGEEKEEFVELLPYTPNQRENLVGWLAARSDGDQYGNLAAYNFPKDRQIDGPSQVEARIDNDQEISAWFTLRCSEGSSCIRGNLLVIPIEDSLLYAEPIYIQAEGSRFPELKRVILASGERVVMEDSLDEALIALTGSSPFTPQTPTPVSPERPEPSTIDQTIRTEIDSLEELIEEIKLDLSSLEEALERLKDLTGGE
jgi:hypothetical protein